MRKRLLCRAVEVPENGLKECEAEDGLKVVVANAGGEFFGFQAICPPQEGPVCEGIFNGSVLTCHMHLWQWDVRTGAPLRIAEAPLQRYPVTVEGDSLYLGGDDSALGAGELFNGLEQSILEKLAALARRESYQAGAMLYQPGGPAEDFFVLESGRVEFLIGPGERTAPGGFMLKKGEVFGWAALLDGYPARIAGARCLEESALLRINGQAALRVLEGDPAAGLPRIRPLGGVSLPCPSSSAAK